MFDTDGNGTIDSYEFICALSLVSHATLDEKAELIFNLYDFDKSLSISKEELTVLMANSLTALKSIEGKPAPTLVEIQTKTDEFFKLSDTDHDNMISLKEFKSYIKKDKQILEVLTSFGVAKSEDLGTDFGAGGEVPDIDSDLEEECNPSGLAKSNIKSGVKDGIDFKAPGVYDEDENKGDQFMAVKPWIGVIKNSVPTGYKPSKRDTVAPDASIELEYIYGYRCHDVRNNLRYTSEGKIAYHSAGVGVILDPKKNVQQFYMSHNDDIHCLAMDPTGTFCATGQIGPKPFLGVWNCKTMEEIHLVSQPLIKGIKHLAFSKDGKLLAASDMFDDHNIAIFDLSAKKVAGKVLAPIAFGKGCKALIMSLGFNSTGDTLVATCVKEVNFFTWTGGVLKATKGTGWGTTPADAVLCQTFVGPTLFTGTFSGELISWNGRGIQKRQKAHTGKVNCLWTRESGTEIISGGSDGLIIIWQVQGGVLSQMKQYDLKMPEIMSMRPEATSVCSNTEGRVLVGTRGGEIVEFNEQNGVPKLLMRSHFDSELWGLATHPTRPEIFTFGRDAMLAVWDLKTRRQTKHCKLQCGGDVVAFSNNGDMIVLGFFNGQFMVLDNNFNAITKRCDKREGKPIQCVKFNPLDTVCAIGAHDGLIFTYDVKQKFKPMKKLSGHHSTITHMDFSLDGAFLMSNCTSYEILFWDVSAGKQLTSGASMLKDEKWATWSCTLGWPVQGIFPPCSDGTDVNACSRSNDGTILATGDDFGLVKLFNYPCPVEKAAFKKSNGHSSHVTNILFTKNTNGQAYLISTGGEDKSILQWKFHQDSQAKEESQAAAEIEHEEPEAVKLDKKEEGSAFDEEETGEGDQKLAVDPFLGQVKSSTPNGFKITPAMGNEPNANLKLKFAFGFRSFDTRNNLKYTNDGHVVYTTAGLGVVMDIKNRTQEFSNLHREDVVAMAIHPDGDIIATGQMAGKDLNEESTQKVNQGAAGGKQAAKEGKLVDIFVWRASTREVLAKIIGFHRRAVRQLAFSPSGTKLLSIGEDDHHSVAIYDWASQRMLANDKVDPDPVYSAVWKNDTEFATCGVKHMKIFTQNGQNLDGKKGAYLTKIPGNNIMMTAVAYVLKGDLVTGVSNGCILKWAGTTCGNPIKGHSDSVWSIVNGSNNTFWSGGNDGKIIQWNNQWTAVKQINISTTVKMEPGIRSLDLSKDQKTMLVGTRGSDVIEINTDNGELLNNIMSGHFKAPGMETYAEVWGCATHPTELLFASAGADRTVRVWNSEKMIVCSEQLAFDPTALDWSSDGKYIAAGDRNGTCKILDAEKLTVLGTINAANAGKKNAWVEDIKFSPDSTMVAFGTHGGVSKLELAKVTQGGKLQKIGSINACISSALTQLDWTLDSTTVVINSEASELYWINVETKKPVNASSAQGFDYATWSCRFGFPVQGIWPGIDYSDVNTVAKSRNGEILATGDDFGNVKIFKYPCVVPKAQFKSYCGHSSHVTKVRFSAGDHMVISTGGGDLTVMLWETDLGSNEPVHPTVEVIQQDYHEDDPSFENKPKSKDQTKVLKAVEAQKISTQQEEAKAKPGAFDEEDQGEGDQFMAVKPWLGAIKAPSGFRKPQKNQNLPPNVQIEIDWVHGYRGSQGRNNLRYLNDGCLGYYAAALGVVYDPNQHQQRFFTPHTDDVTAIDFSLDCLSIATGENGKKPVVYIWDFSSMQQKFKIVGNGITQSIQCVAYSPSGSRLVIVDQSDDHNVAVIDTQTGACIAKSKGDRGAVRDCAWQDETTFVTSGPNHFKQYVINAAGFTTKLGNFGKLDMRHVGCVFNGQTCMTGSMLGQLYLWNGTTIAKAVKLHERIIDAINVTSYNIFTGSRDSKICVLDKSYNLQFQIDCTALPDSVCSWIRAITLQEYTQVLMVGTFGHEIYEIPISLDKKAQTGPAQLKISGHYAPKLQDNNECWGLGVFYNKEQYATVSDDGILKVWDIKQRKQVQSISLNVDDKGQKLPVDPTTKEISNAGQGRSCAVSPKSDYLAVGMRDGSLRVYQTSTWKLAYLKQISKEWIQDLKFSPDNNFLAVGSHDNFIYVFSMPTMALHKKFGKSSSFITQLDWSLDSSSLRTNDASYELMFYSVSDGKQITSGGTNFRDEPWATATCVLTWGSQGIWQKGQKGSDINHCERSHAPVIDGMQLIATCDDDGKVCLFRYPSVQENSGCVKGNGHSSHVTKLGWSSQDNYILSTGGNDTAVIQWKIKK